MTALVLDNASASVRAHPGYDIGFTDAEIAERRALFETLWGTGATLDLIAARFADDERMRADWARYERIAATPTSILAMYDIVVSFDVRDLLPAVAVPTLVLHSATNILIPRCTGSIPRRPHSRGSLFRGRPGRRHRMGQRRVGWRGVRVPDR